MTASPATRAVLTIRAEAVAAVRRGSRSALRWARWPAIPRRPVSRPLSRSTGTARSGASTITAMTRRAQPDIALRTFSSEASFAPASDSSSPAPRASRRVPAAPRTRDAVALGGCSAVRMASTGAIRAALRDGSHAASTVTPTPTASAAATGSGPITRGPRGSDSPVVLRISGSTEAIPRPSRKPRAEAVRPRRTASQRRERTTWRRVAPIARSRAISRVRRATSMVKVLTIRNDPMKRATPAKTSDSFSLPRVSVSTRTACWAAWAVPVVASARSAGSRAATRRASSAASVPGTADRSIEV